MTGPIENRPRPIKKAADQLKAWLGLLGALVSAAGTGGLLLTADQVSAVQGVLAAVPVVAGVVTTLLMAFGVVRRSEPLVTPLEDPMMVQDGRAVRLIPLGR